MTASTCGVSARGPGPGLAAVAPGLPAAMREGEWDVVHVQSYHTAVAPLAMRTARRDGVPYVVTFHGGGHSQALRHSSRPLQRRVLAPLLRGADRLVAVAQFEIEQYGAELGVPPARFALIPNGVDLPELPAGSAPRAARSGGSARRIRRAPRGVQGPSPRHRGLPARARADPRSAALDRRQRAGRAAPARPREPARRRGAGGRPRRPRDRSPRDGARARRDVARDAALRVRDAPDRRARGALARAPAARRHGFRGRGARRPRPCALGRRRTRRPRRWRRRSSTSCAIR